MPTPSTPAGTSRANKNAVAYNPVTIMDPYTNASKYYGAYDQVETRPYYFGKLTYQINKNLKIFGFLSYVNDKIPHYYTGPYLTASASANTVPGGVWSRAHSPDSYAITRQLRVRRPPERTPSSRQNPTATSRSRKANAPRAATGEPANGRRASSHSATSPITETSSR